MNENTKPHDRSNDKAKREVKRLLKLKDKLNRR